MKRHWRALCALLLAAVCTADLLLVSAAAAAQRKSNYFTAVNDTVLEMREDTMPFNSGGEMYVPYTIFDPNSVGIHLGVFASYSGNIVVLYGRTSGALIFDLNQDTATSSTGTKYTRRAIRHNSIVFVPVDMVVKFFGLSWFMAVTKNGMVVRVENGAAQIADAEFTTAAAHTLEARYNSYLQEMGLVQPEPPADTAAPTPAQPSPTPAPPPIQIQLPTLADPSPSPEPQPSYSPTPAVPSPDPEPSGSEEPQPEGGDVFVAVRCGTEGNTAALADALERQGARGVFFFPAGALASRDGEVRALAAAGHKIGLALDGESPAEQEVQARRGGELLRHIICTQVDMVLIQGGELLVEDWLAWPAGVDGTADGRGSSQQAEDILRDAVHPEDCFLLLDDSAQSAALASRLLDEMAGNGCTFRLTLEPMLAGNRSTEP